MGELTLSSGVNVLGVVAGENGVALEDSHCLASSVGDGDCGNVIDCVNDGDRERASSHGCASQSGYCELVETHGVDLEGKTGEFVEAKVFATR